MILPLKIKLTYYEARQLGDYFMRAGRIAIHPQAREELMVLAEISPRFESQVVKAWRDPNKGKVFTYTIPMSVARILHRRLQQEVITSEMQMVLMGLDKELTRRDMKLDPVKPEIF